MQLFFSLGPSNAISDSSLKKHQKCSPVGHDLAMAPATCFQTNTDRILSRGKKKPQSKMFFSCLVEKLQHAFLYNQKMSHVFKQRIFSDFLALNVI